MKEKEYILLTKLPAEYKDKLKELRQQLRLTQAGVIIYLIDKQK